MLFFSFISGFSALHVAIRRKESLVDVSLSTVILLKLFLSALSLILSKQSFVRFASVAINDSIVAISGFIIPDPLAIPVILTIEFEIFISLETALGIVSVVIIDFATSSQESSDKFLTKSGSVLFIFLTGRSSPITPVEKGSTSCSLRLVIFAKALQVA